MFQNIVQPCIYTCFKIPLNRFQMFSKCVYCILKHLWDLSICFKIYMVYFEISNNSVGRAFKKWDVFALHFYFYIKSSQIFFKLISKLCKFKFEVEIFKQIIVPIRFCFPLNSVSKCKSNWKGWMFRNMWYMFRNLSVNLCCFVTNKLCFETLL